MVNKQRAKSTKRTYFTGIGMSMGANLMMKAAGLQGDSFPLDAMVSLNNPFDIWLAINLMRKTPYERYLAIELKQQLLSKKGMSESEQRVFQQISSKFGIDFEAI
jgi:predicted alpha/beta-fold hydrolase